MVNVVPIVVFKYGAVDTTRILLRWRQRVLVDEESVIGRVVNFTSQVRVLQVRLVVPGTEVLINVSVRIKAVELNIV